SARSLTTAPGVDATATFELTDCVCSALPASKVGESIPERPVLSLPQHRRNSEPGSPPNVTPLLPPDDNLNPGRSDARRLTAPAITLCEEDDPPLATTNPRTAARTATPAMIHGAFARAPPPMRVVG